MDVCGLKSLRWFIRLHSAGLQAGLRNAEEDVGEELHRTVSGELPLDEGERTIEDGGLDETIYRVGQLDSGIYDVQGIFLAEPRDYFINPVEVFHGTENESIQSSFLAIAHSDFMGIPNY